jgi:hypothetical protein
MHGQGLRVVDVRLRQIPAVSRKGNTAKGLYGVDNRPPFALVLQAPEAGVAVVVKPLQTRLKYSMQLGLRGFWYHDSVVQWVHCQLTFMLQCSSHAKQAKAKAAHMLVAYMSDHRL